MINRALNIDEKDRAIISMLQKNTEISQTEIAEKVGLSQPSVGMRIFKLKKKGIISIQPGMNFSKVNLFLAKADVEANNTEKVIKSFEKCPFFLNGLIVSGESNLCLFFMSPDLKVLDDLINYHLRAHESVTKVRVDIVIKTAKDFIMPVSLDPEPLGDKKEFREKCKNCPCRNTVYQCDKNFDNYNQSKKQ